MRWAEHVARMEKQKSALRIFIERLEGKVPLERLRHR
jgi:hypothetical protein